jgi:glycosyltransferase involved in cell wall biosynthesis
MGERSMRIAWFTHRYYPCIGGAETYGRAMVKRFVAAGHDVDVFTSNAHDLRYYTDSRRRKVDAAAISEVDGARVHRMAVKHLPLQRYAGRLISYLPRWQTQCQVASYMPIIPGLSRVRGEYDAVFGVGFPFTTFSYAALQTARSAHAPLILTPFLHLSTPGDPVNRTYTRPHQIRLLSEADIVVSPTRLESDVVAGWGIPRDRLMTMPMAIDREDVTGGNGRAYLTKLGLTGKTIVGQLGALDPNKGTPDLIKAINRLNLDRGDPVHLLLAGSATAEFDSFLDGAEWRTKPWLHLLGAIPSSDVPSFYDALDVFAMPSRTDSFGIVYLEAWANGKPVIAANAGGVPEVVTHDENGLLIEFGDVPSLSMSILRLLDDQSFARQLGQAGRARVHNGYTWDNRFTSLIERVRAVIDVRARSKRVAASA